MIDNQITDQCPGPSTVSSHTHRAERRAELGSSLQAADMTGIWNKELILAQSTHGPDQSDIMTIFHTTNPPDWPPTLALSYLWRARQARSGRRVVVSPRHKLPADVESFTVSLAGSAVQQWWWWWWCAPLVQLGLLHHNSPACTRLYWGQIKILIKINRESPPCPGSRVSFYLFPLQKLLITVTGNHLALTEHSGKHQRL